MKAIIFGAGRIGRGFITELLSKNGVEKIFFDYDDKLIEEMNKVKEYTIHVLGAEDKSMLIQDFKAYSLKDKQQMCSAWENSDIIFTAVGGKNLPAVAKYIADTFKTASRYNDKYFKNIITCENWINPAIKLKEAILKELTDEEQIEFNNHIGVSEAVVMATGASAPPNFKLENKIDTWVQDFLYLPVDKEHLLGKIPDWKYFDFISNFGELLQQKIYTNNTSVALIAYLGYLRGYKYVADAANAEEIVPILDEAYKEINQALIKGMGIDKESQLKFSKRAKAKYQDRNIIDLVTRIARDPIRKLGPDDRLIGPCKLALKAGIKPKAIALTTAAALYFDYTEDQNAVKLTTMRKKDGVESILKNISQLSENDELYKMILENIKVLKDKGWLKGESVE